jgi:hypothetical protein
MDRMRNVHVVDQKSVHYFSPENPKKNDHLGNLGISEKILLKWILTLAMVWAGFL